MQNLLILILLITLFQPSCKSKISVVGQELESNANQISTNNMDTFQIQKSEEEWLAQLGPERFAVLREKGTERPFTGSLLHVNEKGIYSCAACGVDLFKSDMKFDAHCGWPSFDNEIPGSIIQKEDRSHGMIRIEILCKQCGGHLGHIFDDGPTETGLRYCVNSLSLEFKKAE